MHNIQRLASHAVTEVLAGRNLNHTLQTLWHKHPELSSTAQAAIQDLSFGVMRHYGLLDRVLALLQNKPISDPLLKSLLLVGLYQLQYGETAAHAVVNEAVKATRSIKKTSAQGLVNALLRNFLRQRGDLLTRAISSSEVARYSHPQWWIDKLRAQYPQQAEQLLQQNNLQPPMTLRINRRLTTVSAYSEMLANAGIAAGISGENAITLGQPVAVAKLPGFLDGFASVQDLSAQHATLLDVADGMRVLDACSAPGGKAAHLLETAELALTALDIDEQRLQKVRQTLDRLKLHADYIIGDAAQPQSWWDGRPYQRILADVPCSASGVVKRHPDIKWLRRDSDIQQFARTQAQILEALWRCLETDGKLLYVTCSVFREENQSQISLFLEQHPDAEQLPLELSAQEGQLLPNADQDGFYYALLKKL